jgi:hypothetical protein
MKSVAAFLPPRFYHQIMSALCRTSHMCFLTSFSAAVSSHFAHSSKLVSIVAAGVRISSKPADPKQLPLDYRPTAPTDIPIHK